MNLEIDLRMGEWAGAGSALSGKGKASDPTLGSVYVRGTTRSKPALPLPPGAQVSREEGSPTSDLYGRNWQSVRGRADRRQVLQRLVIGRPAGNFRQ